MCAYRQRIPRFASSGVGTLENHALCASVCVGCLSAAGGAAEAADITAVRVAGAGLCGCGCGCGAGAGAWTGHVGQMPSMSIVPHRRQYCGMSKSMPP
jgi:hypothetical protein